MYTTSCRTGQCGLHFEHISLFDLPASVNLFSKIHIQARTAYFPRAHKLFLPFWAGFTTLWYLKRKNFLAITSTERTTAWSHSVSGTMTKLPETIKCTWLHFDGPLNLLLKRCLLSCRISVSSLTENLYGHKI